MLLFRYFFFKRYSRHSLSNLCPLVLVKIFLSSLNSHTRRWRVFLDHNHWWSFRLGLRWWFDDLMLILCCLYITTHLIFVTTITTTGCVKNLPSVFQSERGKTALYSVNRILSQGNFCRQFTHFKVYILWPEIAVMSKNDKYEVCIGGGCNQVHRQETTRPKVDRHKQRWS